MGQVLGEAHDERRQQAQAMLDQVDSLSRAEPRRQGGAIKTFSLHIGATLNLPTPNSKQHSSFERASAEVSAPAAAEDPFEGLPFKALADRMGESFMPVVQAVREEKRAARMKANLSGEAAMPMLPVPHFLPITRWAAQSDSFKSTFVAEDPKIRKKARLSWYHPDDTMVPRGWWKMGLLEDLKYYRPFQQ